ncbi:MAG: carbohydrate kinase family protein [Gemmatimonadetes bacterium]|uniref:Carbohydrate kinase family protein n=1 Tax=Candidatus Kutchimonas denitrificans TaxID=3056748 RepID=A0AAE4ZB45_9BACT|nr:carbohydrate kinase family protein [Gemmatimonadota bacterium]NIR75576.1 carbohydrate kinase family protein [Candidatus Kutchimonas denitrificans]NIS01890.1 carbohydrate kinase family protein [Gemmatimonadota bacterium]NIT67671.1 carbohydrate kinase family protein [Gemmatimonadota bacterium]NIU53545.1 hypothetical protein [Gemmatimonadota bacterium]
MVWDTIWRDDDVGSPVEEWGGITYALAAADAVRPPDLEVRPVIRLGRDLSQRGLSFLGELTSIDTYDTLSIVDEPNPRVELHYRGQERRCERLHGGVSPWSWSELEARVHGCDALYVNFITGRELDLSVARRLRETFAGPIYADIHSLMLATGPQGERRLRPLERWADWLECFDVVQVNEDELRTLSAHWGDPWAFAADVVGRRTRLLFVTLGAGGAVYFITAGSSPLDGPLRRDAPVQTGKLAVEPLEGGDPTGCGDVWGVTAMCGLLAGRGVEDSMRRANAAARRNVSHCGASGLNRYLRGELERA